MTRAERQQPFTKLYNLLQNKKREIYESIQFTAALSYIIKRVWDSDLSFHSIIS